jgi:hypothetical protein
MEDTEGPKGRSMMEGVPALQPASRILVSTPRDLAGVTFGDEGCPLWLELLIRVLVIHTYADTVVRSSGRSSTPSINITAYPHMISEIIGYSPSPPLRPSSDARSISSRSLRRHIKVTYSLTPQRCQPCSRRDEGTGDTRR